MKPIDFRNATYEQVRKLITAQRSAVWVAWIAHGPATTRAAAQASGIDLLTFRPRTTELYQLGGVMLAEEQDAETRRHGDAETSENPSPRPRVSASPRLPAEGIYRARTDAEWRAWLEAQRAGLLNTQMPLPLEEQSSEVGGQRSEEKAA